MLNRQKALAGGGITLGVAILCASGLVAFSTTYYFFDGWGVFPSAVFYICLLCSAVLGGLLAFYAEKKLRPTPEHISICAIGGVFLSLLFIWVGGAAHILFVDWYISCQTHDAGGCYSVGHLHKNDLLLWSDPQSATQYFKKACANGSWGGCIYALEGSSESFEPACEMFAYCSERLKDEIEQTTGTNAINSVECQSYRANCLQN